MKDINGFQMLRPCGQCLACRLNYAKTWSIRAQYEAMCWPHNVFATFTYSPECLPEDRSVHVDEAQKLLKRIRKHSSSDLIRYMISGEYGDLNFRPHYHALLFNVDKFNDPLFYNLSYDRKCKGYWCECKAWDKGFVFLGDVNVDTANYVAKYVVKKQVGKNAEDYYSSRGIDREFMRCSTGSRKDGLGGLGLCYYRQHAERFKSLGYCEIKGQKFAIPRYFTEKDDEATIIRRKYSKYHLSSFDMCQLTRVKDMNDIIPSIQYIMECKGLKVPDDVYLLDPCEVAADAHLFDKLCMYKGCFNEITYKVTQKRQVDEVCKKWDIPENDFAKIETALFSEKKQRELNMKAKYSLYNKRSVG